MVDKIILISERDGQLDQITARYRLCQQYDNETLRLVFVRPDAYMDANLVLRFDVGDREPKRVDLGNDNTYIITGALTRSIRLRIQVAFERNGRQIRASVYQPYTLDESLSDGGAPIEPLPTPALTRLIAGAFVKAGYSGNVLSFSNLAGETVDQVTIIGGGGTGSGNVSSGQIMSIWVGSLADYETMAKDDETLYFIEG